MDTFTVGVGKVDITPPLSIPYIGFKPRHDFFTGVHDPLYARSLFLSDGKTEVIIISVDGIGFSGDILGPGRNFNEELRRRIQGKTGVPAQNIMVASSHIHSTPETLDIRPLRSHPGAEAWLEDLLDRLTDSARISRKQTFPAVLKTGKGKAENISHNRRGDDCLDEEVIVLMFLGRKGEKAFLVNFACHPVILQVQKLVSADFVGVLTGNVERMIEGTRGCFFLQGACGDINPLKNDSRDFNDASYTGLVLTGEVLKIFGKIGLHSPPAEPVLIRADSEKAPFPSRPLPDNRTLKAAEEKAKQMEERRL